MKKHTKIVEETYDEQGRLVSKTVTETTETTEYPTYPYPGGVIYSSGTATWNPKPDTSFTT
jgi:hypothetical protein